MTTKPLHAPATYEPPTAPAARISAVADRGLCRRILPRVSRTFALGIGLLPPGLEHSVLVAYLLCRIADTIEDTTLLDPQEKVRLLAHFGTCVNGAGGDPAPLQQAFAHPTSDDEWLAREADVVLREFRRLPPPHRAAIAPRVREMCAGMAEFAGSGYGRAEQRLSGLGTLEDLDRYCYYVAGTVGHLLTDLFQLHHRSVTPRHYRRLQSLATSFGLGLQLTNIIKDVADDRRRGWSFVPRQLCALAGVDPENFQDQRHREQARRVMDLLIDKAKGHLCDALDYCTALPRRQYRIRLFCLTPMYLAVRTLRRAERDPALLDADLKVKITRPEVTRTVAVARVLAPANTLVRRYFHRLAGPEWRRRCHA